MEVKDKNIKESFELLLYLGEKYDGQNFTIEFSSGALLKKYTCSYDGTDYVNCSMADSKHVLCVIDNAGLACGLLSVRINVEYPDSRLADGTYDIGDKRLVVAVDADGKQYHIRLTNGESTLINTSEMTWELLGSVLKGDKGDAGVNSVYIGEGDMPDECNFQIDPSATPIDENNKFIHITEDDSKVNINLDTDIDGNLSVDGNADVTGDTSITGNLTVEGEFKPNGDVEFDGNVKVDEVLSVDEFNSIKTSTDKLGDKLDSIDVTSIIDKENKLAKLKEVDLYDEDFDDSVAKINSDENYVYLSTEKKIKATASNSISLLAGENGNLMVSETGTKIENTGGSVDIEGNGVNVKGNGSDISIYNDSSVVVYKSDAETKSVSVKDDTIEINVDDNCSATFDKDSKHIGIVSPDVVWTQKVAVKGELKYTTTYKTETTISGSYYMCNTPLALKQGEYLILDTDGHKVALFRSNNVNDQIYPISVAESTIEYQAVRDMNVYVGTEEYGIYAHMDVYDINGYTDKSVSLSEQFDYTSRLRRAVYELQQEIEGLKDRISELEAIHNVEGE